MDLALDQTVFVSTMVSTSIIVPVNGCFVHMTAVKNEALQTIKAARLRVCAPLIIMTNNLPHL